ncbi:glycosyltransferase family protein [Alphaproteobacteria bacterium]|nr:glycosyltransferase family protein [Alphaproteobacteria bacterium]
MKIVAIIQARMGSSRRPGKIMANIIGKPMLDHLIMRVMAAEKLDEVVVATTSNVYDDILLSWGENRDIKVFRGDEDDVLSRFYHCSVKFKADVIVRITADDPLKDPEVINHAITLFKNNPTIDYVSNTITPTFPEGIDVEVFSFDALCKAHSLAIKKSDREHVTPYIWRNSDQFNILNFSANTDMSNTRLTVDYEEDLAVVTAIIDHFQDQPLVGYQEIVNFLNNSPNLATINSSILRNEGYIKSISNED